jgi:hypothetical protein
MNHWKYWVPFAGTWAISSRDILEEYKENPDAVITWVTYHLIWDFGALTLLLIYKL